LDAVLVDNQKIGLTSFFFGHQISAHINPGKNTRTHTNIIDNDNIPIRHFGLAVPWKEWHKLVEKFKAKKI